MLAGQAGRTIGYALHHAGMIVMTVLLLAMFGIGALAFRLSEGPVQVPWLTSRLATAVSGPGITIHVAQAALAWDGYKNGGGSPLSLQLGGITIRNATGVTLAGIDGAQLVWLPGSLFGSQAPIAVTSSKVLIAGSDVPVSLRAAIRLNDWLDLSQADLVVTLGGGDLGITGMTLPITGGALTLHLTPGSLTLSGGGITLRPVAGSAPHIGLAGSFVRDASWHGALAVTGDEVSAAALAMYWPPALAPQTRDWVSSNITGGAASGASFVFGLSAPRNLSSLSLDSAHGSFTGTNLTLIWLPQAQPITALNGVLTLTDRDNIVIAASSGRLGGVGLQTATMQITGLSHKDQTATLDIPVAGTLPAALAVLDAPPLMLLKGAPPALLGAAGNFTGSIGAALPMRQKLALRDVSLKVAAALNGTAIEGFLPGEDFSDGALALTATTHGLSLKGTGSLGGQAAALALTAGFGPRVAIGLELDTVITPALLQRAGVMAGTDIAATIPVALHIAADEAGTGTLTLTGDLQPARLSLPALNWHKPVGADGNFSLAASLAKGSLASIDELHAEAPGLAIDSQRDGRSLQLTRLHIGSTEGQGRITPPARPGAAWQFQLSGSALDLSALINPPPSTAPATAATPPPTGGLNTPSGGLKWTATGHFTSLILAPAPAPPLRDASFTGTGAGSTVTAAAFTATTEPGHGVALNITPQAAPAPAYFTLHADDGGAFLRATGVYDDLSGGIFDIDASYSPQTLSGTAHLNSFRLLHAPALGKILQALTIYGAPEAASGPGLAFTRLIAPFTLNRQVVTLKDARAYSASLGFTATGNINLAANSYDINGTVIPAYALNALPGKIPLIGKLFAPEKGGGLFAMDYRLHGPMANPIISINPLSALTPGFLRGLFGVK